MPSARSPRAASRARSWMPRGMAHDAVLPPRGLQHHAVGLCRRALLPGEPAGPGGAIRQRGSEPALRRIAERMREVVGDDAAVEQPAGDEAVGVVAEVLLVDALELDREVGRAAVV